MKRIFTADLHIHEFAKDLLTTDDGSSFKLKELLNAFEQMCKYAISNNIKEIFIGGDIVHHNNLVHARPFSKFRKLLNKYNNLKFCMYIGNHECGKADETNNALDLLESDNVWNIKSATKYENMTIIPHSNELYDNIKNAEPNDILLSHFPLSEASADSGLKISGKFSIKDLTKFKLVLLGDYHTPQDLKYKDTKIYYSGSPIPFTRAETVDKRFLVFDNETLEVESIPITGYRKYYDITIDESTKLDETVKIIENLKKDGHYVVVRNTLKEIPKKIENIVENVIFIEEYQPEFQMRGISSSMADNEQFEKYLEIENITNTKKYIGILSEALNATKQSP